MLPSAERGLSTTASSGDVEMMMSREQGDSLQLVVKVLWPPDICCGELMTPGDWVDLIMVASVGETGE